MSGSEFNSEFVCGKSSQNSPILTIGHEPDPEISATGTIRLEGNNAHSNFLKVYISSVRKYVIALHRS